MRPRQTAQFWAILIAFTVVILLAALIPRSAASETPAVQAATQIDEAAVQQQGKFEVRRKNRLVDTVKNNLFRAQFLYTVEGNRQQVAEVARKAAVVASKARSAPRTVARTVTSTVVSGDVWDRLANCESGDPAANTGNGFQGAFQFMDSTWDTMNTGYASANLAPYSVQLDAAKRLAQKASPYTQWPTCWPKAVGG